MNRWGILYLPALALSLSCNGWGGANAPANQAGGVTPGARAEAKPNAEFEASTNPGLSQVQLRFVGDVIFGRYRGDSYSPIPRGNFSLFEKAREHLRGDLAIANLETPLVEELPKDFERPGKLFFAATPDAAAQLADAGFHAVSIANNHAFDMGRRGLEQTPRILERLGIHAVGRALPRGEEFRVESVRAKDLRVALISITTWLNFPVPETFPAVPFSSTSTLVDKLLPLIQSAKASHDLVVVLVHWGTEYETRTSPAQRSAGRGLVDAGADFVIGHHPHVLGEVELYRGGLIAYSLGNFLFENLGSVPRLTGVLKLDLSGRGYCDVHVDFEPFEIIAQPTFHPVPASRRAARRVRGLVSPTGASNVWEVTGDRLTARYDRCEVR